MVNRTDDVSHDVKKFGGLMTWRNDDCILFMKFISELVLKLPDECKRQNVFFCFIFFVIDDCAAYSQMFCNSTAKMRIVLFKDIVYLLT